MKKYHVEYTKEAQKDISKMDNPIRIRIKNYIFKHLEGCENPRLYGKPLHGPLRGNWSYPVGNYRIVAKIEDDKILINIVEVGHRGDIYNQI